MTPTAWANWAKDKARDVAREYGQAKGIRYLPESQSFIDAAFRKLPNSVIQQDLFQWIVGGNVAAGRAAIRDTQTLSTVARATVQEMQGLFAVPRRPVSPGVLAEWTRAYQAYDGTPGKWREARVEAVAWTDKTVIVPMRRHPRVRLYVTAEPYWAGLRVGEWEPRPGRQNAPA